MRKNHKIKYISMYFSSYLGYRCTVSLYDNGKTYYQTNFREETPDSCALLLNRQTVVAFLESVSSVLEWQTYYGTGKCIDGYYWNVKAELADGTIKESVGENGKPDDFDEFIARCERLIKKPLDSTQVFCGKEQ